jgi:hypothetical protein
LVDADWKALIEPQQVARRIAERLNHIPDHRRDDFVEVGGTFFGA